MANAQDSGTPADQAAGPKPGDGLDISEAALKGDTAQTGQDSIDELLKQAAADMQAAPADGPAADGAAAAPITQAAGLENLQGLDLPDLQQVDHAVQASGIDLLRDVDLNVKIELGRTRMLVEDVLKLSEGAVVELDKLAGDPVDVFVNDRLVARGEVLVLNDSFCVRINEIVATAQEDAA